MSNTPPTFGRPAGGDPGPEDDVTPQRGRPSSLQDLRGELAAEVAPAPVTYPVELRPGYAIRYSCDIPAELLRAWLARGQMKDGGADAMKQSLAVLTNQCEAILRFGEPIGEGGADVTFAARDFRELIGADSPAAAVRKFYGSDGYVISTAEAVISAAGYGARISAEEADPTKS